MQFFIILESYRAHYKDPMLSTRVFENAVYDDADVAVSICQSLNLIDNSLERLPTGRYSVVPLSLITAEYAKQFLETTFSIGQDAAPPAPPAPPVTTETEITAPGA